MATAIVSWHKCVMVLRESGRSTDTLLCLHSACTASREYEQLHATSLNQSYNPWYRRASAVPTANVNMHSRSL